MPRPREWRLQVDAVIATSAAYMSGTVAELERIFTSPRGGQRAPVATWLCPALDVLRLLPVSPVVLSILHPVRMRLGSRHVLRAGLGGTLRDFVICISHTPRSPCIRMVAGAPDSKAGSLAYTLAAVTGVCGYRA